MNENIKLLEDRVDRAAKRLKRLSAERKRLESEVQGLQSRLEHLSRKRSDDDPVEAGKPEATPEGWSQQRAEIVAALRDTIAELRGE